MALSDCPAVAAMALFLITRKLSLRGSETELLLLLLLRSLAGPAAAAAGQAAAVFSPQFSPVP